MLQDRKFHYARFGEAQVVCGAHFSLLCAGGNMVTCVVNGASVASQQQYHRWDLLLPFFRVWSAKTFTLITSGSIWQY